MNAVVIMDTPAEMDDITPEIQTPVPAEYGTTYSNPIIIPVPVNNPKIHFRFIITPPVLSNSFLISNRCMS